MKLFILQLLFFGLATAVFADDLENFSITTNQVAAVKQKLEAFDKGTVSLDEITIDCNGEWGRTLLA